MKLEDLKANLPDMKEDELLAAVAEFRRQRRMLNRTPAKKKGVNLDVSVEYLQSLLDEDDE